MKRITKKVMNDFLTKSFDIKPSTIKDDENNMIYYSKLDGSYATRVGMEDELKFLLKRGVVDQLQSSGGNIMSLGFNHEENKWYGWSHRAMLGFTIGSECKPEYCHYKPKNKEEFKHYCLRFWGDTDMDGDTHKTNPIAIEKTQDGKLGIYVEYTYNNKLRNEKLRGQISGVFSEYPEVWGKGEWTAETMEDAKQMAKDFSQGVS